MFKKIRRKYLLVKHPVIEETFIQKNINFFMYTNHI